MRNLIYLLLLASMNAGADDDAYYCVGEDRNGFQYSSSGYARQYFVQTKFMVRINGRRLDMKGAPYANANGAYECESPVLSDDATLLRCTRDFVTFNFNTKNGHFTHADASGWLTELFPGVRSSMYIEYGKCDKFD